MTPEEYVEYAVHRHNHPDNTNPLRGTSIGSEVMREILTKYVATPENRQTLARAMVEPTRLRLMCADTAMKAEASAAPYFMTREGVMGLLKDEVTNATNFLSMIPPEEATAEPYRQLRSLLGDMRGLKDVVERTPR